MTITDRRRALMGAQGGGSIPLSDLSAGSGVIIGTSKFIIVRKESTVIHLLRDKLMSTKRKMLSASGSGSYYDNSNVDTYLTGEYKTAMPLTVQNNLVEYSFSIDCYDSGGTKTTKTIQRKIAIPTYNSLSSDGLYVQSLKLYYNTTSYKTARVGYQDGASSAITWWNADAYDATHMKAVDGFGQNGSSWSTYTAYGVRPLLFLSPDTPVKIVNGEYTIQ